MLNRGREEEMEEERDFKQPRQEAVISTSPQASTEDIFSSPGPVTCGDASYESLQALYLRRSPLLVEKLRPFLLMMRLHLPRLTFRLAITSLWLNCLLPPMVLVRSYLVRLHQHLQCRILSRLQQTRQRLLLALRHPPILPASPLMRALAPQSLHCQALAL